MRQLARQQLAVGGQRDVVKVEFGHGSQKGIQARADQWLTASNPQTLDAGGFDQIGHATGQGIRRQLVLRRHQPLAVGYAVGASVVAGSRQADAQVAKAPALTIDNHE
ncbi:hypothetical protein D9M71_710350 [compost metagenome]